MTEAGETEDGTSRADAAGPDGASVADDPVTAPAILPADAPDVADRAAASLAQGRLVALPTETVYGLAVDATSPEAVARLYAAKGRPARNPLICHVDGVAMAERIGRLDARARALADAFWPGPVTIVVPRASASPVAPAATADGPTVAIRMPDEPLFRRVVTALGRPVAAPSANRSGRVSATTAADVVAELADRVALVVDGGPSPLGLESTVVDLSGPEPRILRPGALESERIAAVLGRHGGTIERDDGETPAPSASRGAGAAALAAPGMLASHYAPAAAVRLDVAADALRPGEAYLAFGPGAPPAKAVSVYQLSEGGDLAEAARNLYHGLRALDRSGAATIAVAPIPARGLGIAIRDRLARAAAPRGNGG